MSRELVEALEFLLGQFDQAHDALGVSRSLSAQEAIAQARAALAAHRERDPAEPTYEYASRWVTVPVPTNKYASRCPKCWSFILHATAEVPPCEFCQPAPAAETKQCNCYVCTRERAIE